MQPAHLIESQIVKPDLSALPSLEKKAYGRPISSEEREMLKAQVFIYEDNILYYREAPIMSVPQLEVYQEKISELVKDFDSFYILIDLTQAAPPRPEERYFLKEAFSTYKGLRHFSVFTNENFFLGIAAKFVIRTFGKEFSVHKTFAQALKKTYQLKYEESQRNQ